MGFFSSLFGGGKSSSSVNLDDSSPGKKPGNKRQQSGGATTGKGNGAAAKPADTKPKSVVEDLKAERRQKRLEEEQQKPKQKYDAMGLPVSADGPVLMEAEPDETNVRRVSEYEEEEWVATEDGGFTVRSEEERRRSMAAAAGEPMPPVKSESSLSSPERVADPPAAAGDPRSTTNKTYESSLFSTMSTSYDDTTYRRSGDTVDLRDTSVTKTHDSDKTLSYRGTSVRASLQSVSAGGKSRADFGRHASSTTLAMVSERSGISNGEPVSPGFVKVRMPGEKAHRRYVVVHDHSLGVYAGEEAHRAGQPIALIPLLMVRAVTLADERVTLFGCGGASLPGKDRKTRSGSIKLDPTFELLALDDGEAKAWHAVVQAAQAGVREAAVEHLLALELARQASVEERTRSQKEKAELKMAHGASLPIKHQIVFEQREARFDALRARVAKANAAMKGELVGQKQWWDGNRIAKLWAAAVAGSAKQVSGALGDGVLADAQRPADGKTALMLACEAGAAGQPAVEALLTAGAQVELRSDDAKTALHFACAALSGKAAASDADLRTVQWLLRHGAPVGSPSDDASVISCCRAPHAVESYPPQLMRTLDAAIEADPVSWLNRHGAPAAASTSSAASSPAAAAATAAAPAAAPPVANGSGKAAADAPVVAEEAAPAAAVGAAEMTEEAPTLTATADGDSDSTAKAGRSRLPSELANELETYHDNKELLEKSSHKRHSAMNAMI